MQTALESKTNHLTQFTPIQFYGHICRLSPQSITLQGLSKLASLGDQVEMYDKSGNSVYGEIIALHNQDIVVSAYADISGLKIGSRAYYRGQSDPRPSILWLGHTLNHAGYTLAGHLPPQGETGISLKAGPPKSRNTIGKRMDTGIAAIDTFLPLCRGQRLGLFAGSGVGKSTLLADLAKGADADIVILALVGERGREVRDFTQGTLGESGMKKSIVFVATSDEPPALKLKTAFLAMATAEYFRNRGKHVLLLFDSLTRFAEAHRSVALSAGETPSLRAFPPSTFQALAQLCERAGPGSLGQGDITAVFSVLVAGSNMEEPVADMVRGILDGHIVLDRGIAERGRYPAMDVRRSVSRSLPNCASDDENALLAQARRLIGVYEESRTLISAGLYQPGSDPVLDEAVQKYDRLDEFISLKAQGNATQSYGLLAEILNNT